MGKGTIFGIVIGFGMLVAGFLLDKGNLMSLFLTSPALIVFGGTAGAVMISYSMDDIKQIFPLVKRAMSESKISLNRTLETIMALSAKARKEGLLILESIAQEDKFIKENDELVVTGITLLMQGFTEDTIVEVMDQELEIFDQVKKREISMFEAAGGFSPTMGIIGTVMGLIQVLANITNAEELAGSIAIAFVATLYGVVTANLLYLPIANKLTLHYKLERLDKEMIIDGILALNNGYSPIEVKERLLPYLKYNKKSKNIPVQIREVKTDA